MVWLPKLLTWPKDLGHFKIVSISSSVCQAYPFKFFCHWRGLLSELVQGRELCLSCSVVETMGVFQLFLNHPFEISKESQWLYKLLCSGSHHQLGWSSGKRNPSATCLALGHLRGMMQCEQIHQIYEKHLWLGLLNTGRLRRVLVPYATVATYRKTEHNPSLHARLCRSLHHICLCFW